MSTKVDDTLHLKNFIEIINKADNARQREVKIDVAKDYAAEDADIQSRKTESNSGNDISMDGGGFKE